MRTETLKVAGMTCGGCVSSVTKALRAVDGVSAVAVSLQAGEARVDFDEKATSPERLRAAVQKAGFNAEERTPAHRANHGCCQQAGFNAEERTPAHHAKRGCCG